MFPVYSVTNVPGLYPRSANVDMNRNGVWDRRETPTEAWHRLGLLPKNEALTRATYVACVQRAAERLRAEGFFADGTAAWYVEQAKATDLQPKRSPSDR